MSTDSHLPPDTIMCSGFFFIKNMTASKDAAIHSSHSGEETDPGTEHPVD
jgi:hypothetical protein